MAAQPMMHVPLIPFPSLLPQEALWPYGLAIENGDKFCILVDAYEAKCGGDYS